MLVDTMVMYGADPAAPCATALPHADMPARPVAASAGIPGLLRGSVDLLRRNLVEGWARDEAAPHQPVPLVILVDGVEVARQLACHYRADLVAAGFGSGRYGFSAVIPWLDAAKPHVVTICRASDGAQIERSPAIIHPSPYFDAALEQDVAALFESIEPGPEQERVAAFLEAQMDLLQQRRGGPRPASTNHRRVTRPSAPARPPAGSADLPGSRRAVVIDQTIPMEGDPAAQALLSHMRALQDMDYAVSFVQAQTPTHADTAAAALEEMGIGCSRAPYYVPVEAVIESLAGAVEVVYFHRVPNLAFYLPLVRQHMPQARVLFRVGDGARNPLEPMSRPRSIQWSEVDPDWPTHTALSLPPVEAALLRQAGRGRTLATRSPSRWQDAS